MAGSRTSPPDEAAAGERDELLATKLNIPQTRRDHLTRSRLIKGLNEGMAREVTLVCTPAGFGKTSLLADWAATARWPVAWLSLDPEDDDPIRFWRYAVVALDRAFGGIGERVLPLLSPADVQPGQGVVTALINELVATPKELALVLDDYHTVESQPIHDDMAFLLSHLPPQLHVVITSRSDPPLPLARLRAAGQLAELRAADLRFTPPRSRRPCCGRCGGWTSLRRPSRPWRAGRRGGRWACSWPRSPCANDLMPTPSFVRSRGPVATSSTT